MEASLIDMTRGHELYVPAFNPYLEIEVVRHDEPAEDATEYAIEYAIEGTVVRAPIEDVFADPWFAVHEDALTTGEELPPTPIATRQSLHAVLGFAVAIAVAAWTYAATL